MKLIDILKAHQPEPGHRSLHQHCTCGWTGEPLAYDFLNHQADALDAAGFGAKGSKDDV